MIAFFPLDPFHMEGVGHWTFESGTMENVGSGGSALGHGTMTTGSIVEVLDRSSKVMQCKGDSSSNENCFAAPVFSNVCFSK